MLSQFPAKVQLYANGGHPALEVMFASPSDAIKEGDAFETIVINHDRVVFKRRSSDDADMDGITVVRLNHETASRKTAPLRLRASTARLRRPLLRIFGAPFRRIEVLVKFDGSELTVPIPPRVPSELIPPRAIDYPNPTEKPTLAEAVAPEPRSHVQQPDGTHEVTMDIGGKVRAFRLPTDVVVQLAFELAQYEVR